MKCFRVWWTLDGTRSDWRTDWEAHLVVYWQRAGRFVRAITRKNKVAHGLCHAKMSMGARFVYPVQASYGKASMKRPLSLSQDRSSASGSHCHHDAEDKNDVMFLWPPKWRHVFVSGVTQWSFPCQNISPTSLLSPLVCWISTYGLNFLRHSWFVL